jgi:hypothetical protein
MPITITFDIEQASFHDGNDRTRIIAAFSRLGWEHIGGSAWRYPALGSENASEDWFNHVIPALMYFRSIVEHAGLDVYNFTIDAHSEAGHRGKYNPVVGEKIMNAADIKTYPANPQYDAALSDERLRKFIADAAASL